MMLKTLLTTSAIAVALAMPTALGAEEAAPEEPTSETLDAAPEAGASGVDVSPIDESGSDTGAVPSETNEPTDETMGQEGTTEPADDSTGQEGTTEPATDETMGQEGTTEPADDSTGQEGTTEPATDETMGQEGTTEPAAEEATGQEDAGESEAAPVVSTDAVIPEEEEGALRADKVIGMKVVDSKGEQIGKITDIILTDGQMTGLVISSGGFLGIGSKQVGIKADEANIDVESETVDTNLSEEALEQAPKFKTQEDIQAELEAKQRQQEMESQQQQPAAGTY